MATRLSCRDREVFGEPREQRKLASKHRTTKGEWCIRREVVRVEENPTR
jgi:hypothetical protein